MLSKCHDWMFFYLYFGNYCIFIEICWKVKPRDARLTWLVVSMARNLLESDVHKPMIFPTLKQQYKYKSYMPNLFAWLTECRSNSMGAVAIRNASDMFGSLLSDTEEHFRQHRDSLSPRADDQSASVYVKPEVKINATSSSSSHSSEDESNPSLDLAQPHRGGNANATSGKSGECAAINSDLSNSQLLAQQDQCCPGFTMPKSNKMRHQGNNCVIF